MEATEIARVRPALSPRRADVVLPASELLFEVATLFWARRTRYRTHGTSFSSHRPHSAGAIVFFRVRPLALARRPPSTRAYDGGVNYDDEMMVEGPTCSLDEVQAILATALAPSSVRRVDVVDHAPLVEGQP